MKLFNALQPHPWSDSESTSFDCPDSILSVKLIQVFHLLVLAYVLKARKNRLIETVLAYVLVEK